MALFGGKKQDRQPPVDRVRAMMQGGTAEKDIIRQLKAEGYSFGEVEKAMMAAVKEGVGPAPAGAGMGAPPGWPEQAGAEQQTQMQYAPPQQAYPYPEQQYAPAYPPPQPYGPPPQAYGPPPQAYSSQPSAARYDMPAAAGSSQPYSSPAGSSYYQEQPPQSMEDLVESVLEEKFEKFAAETKALRDEIAKTRNELGAVKSMAIQKGVGGEVPKELSDRLEELEARIGGLEKAFRQFLPVLSENVEAIRKAVHAENEGQR